MSQCHNVTMPQATVLRPGESGIYFASPKPPAAIPSAMFLSSY
jgi:hypothetical protein